MSNAALKIAKELRMRFACDGEGAFCNFFRLSDDIGIKYYQGYRNIAEATYLLQQEYHQMGHSVSCWGFASQHGDSAYFTKVVTPIKWMKYSELGGPFAWSMVYQHDLTEIFQSLEISKLVPFCRLYDLHWGNVSIDPETGKFIVIDFSHSDLVDDWRHW